MRRSYAILLILLPIGLCLCATAAYFAPPIHSRVAWRVENAAAAVRRWWNPPEALVFVPQGVNQSTAATLTAMPQTILPSAVPAEAAGAPATAAPSALPTPSSTPEPTQLPTPLPPPPSARLSGLRHEYQQFNNCGPANLSMALSYWGWQGDQRATRAFLRPNLEVDDKNVNPEEMVAYVEGQAGLRAIARVGGDNELLKRLVAANFPVIIEAGHDPSDDWWMGHYLVVSGYDDALAHWTVQDSLTNPDLPMSYAELGPNLWRDFNYVYVLIYPPEREAEVQAILGPRFDATASLRLAEQRAMEDIAALQGRDAFFAWFNLGASRVGLQDYAGAADAYDQAFTLYAQLPEDLRPYRLMWYQAGPYEAYYHMARYDDVVSLANATFTWAGKAVLEESLYWRGMAYLKLGIQHQALADLTKAAELNPLYAAPRQALEEIGAPVP